LSGEGAAVKGGFAAVDDDDEDAEFEGEDAAVDEDAEFEDAEFEGDDEVDAFEGGFAEVVDKVDAFEVVAFEGGAVVDIIYIYYLFYYY